MRRWQTQSEDSTWYSSCGCSKCGTAFLHPAPTDQQLADAYAATYYGAGKTKFNPYVERFRTYFSTLRARRLTRNLPEACNILDVGCGDGSLLGHLARTGAHTLHGIELPGAAAERAVRVPGLHLHLGTLSSVALPANSFDLITLVHVVEHLPAPREALDRLAELLKPGGRLFLAFPNIASWQARWFGGHWFHLDPPRHLALVPPVMMIRHLASKGLRLESEQHLCVEQNIYGWIQSALNRLDSRRNFLYERLKRNRCYVPSRGTGTVLAHAATAGMLLIPALILDAAAAVVASGATVELTFRKG